MRTQPNLNGYSVGGKIITQNIAPHLDSGLDDKIEIKVNRNINFEAMVRMFAERNVIYLSDFARYTRHPNKLHAMALSRDWSPIPDKDGKVLVIQICR